MFCFSLLIDCCLVMYLCILVCLCCVGFDCGLFSCGFVGCALLVYVYWILFCLDLDCLLWFIVLFVGGFDFV